MFYFFPSTLLKCFWARHWIQLQVCSLVTDHAPYSVCHFFIHYFQGQLITQLQDLSVLSDHGKIEQCMFKKKKKRHLPIFLYLCIRHPWRTHVTSCFGLSENQDCPATISWFTFTLSQHLDSEITMEPIKKRHAAAVVRAALCKEKTWCKQKMEKNQSVITTWQQGKCRWVGPQIADLMRTLKVGNISLSPPSYF